MCINPAQAFTVEGLRVDQVEDFLMCGQLSLWQSLKKAQDLVAVPEVAAGQLANNEGMGHHVAGRKEVLKQPLRVAEMVYPH